MRRQLAIRQYTIKRGYRQKGKEYNDTAQKQLTKIINLLPSVGAN